MFVRGQARVQLPILITFYKEDGQAWAKYELGECCYYGKGVSADMTEAARLYCLAADHMRKLEF